MVSRLTSLSDGDRASSAASLVVHSATSPASVLTSVYWYCARLVRVAICTSCTGWK